LSVSGVEVYIFGEAKRLPDLIFEAAFHLPSPLAALGEPT
jgi:hypothetical protein